MIGIEVLVALGLINSNKGTSMKNKVETSDVWVRRYATKNGKLTKYWTKVSLPIGVNRYGSNFDTYAPDNTRSIYLSEKHEWGYSEEIPPSPCEVFMSPQMRPIVKELTKKLP